MKQKTSKIVLVLASLFFGVFFFFNTALAETGDKGIIVEGFYYNENNELTFAWSVDAGYNEWRQSITGSSLDIDYIDLTGWLYLQSWYWERRYLTDMSSIDCGYVDPEYGDLGYNRIYLNDFGSKVCTVRFGTIGRPGSYAYYASGDYLTKTEIDNYLPVGGNFESGSLSFVDYMFDIGFLGGSHSTYTYESYEPFTTPTGDNWFPLEYDAVTDGACGTVDGSSFNYADFSTQDWCSAGDFYFSGTEYNGTMFYYCTGTGGGTTDNCSASYYINGDCGTVSGTTQTSLGIENENLCSYNYLIDETSFSTTATGWSWICSGLYGGYDSFCSANKTDVAFPDLPETEDCSSYTFPNNWICNINNTITSAFLPSAEKINELNLSINEIQQKAPFNYLNTAKNKITELTGNISQGGLSLTLMGTTSLLNNTGLTDLASTLKKFFTFLLILAFLFWGINYIKHFFK